MEQIEKLYESEGYPPATRFRQIAKKQFPISQVNAFLESLNTQVYEKVKKPSNRHIRASLYDFILYIDLLDCSRYSKENSGYTFLCNIVEYRTKYAWSYPLKHKTSAEVAKCLEESMKSLPHYKDAWFKIVSDKGQEFADITKMLNKEFPNRFYYLKNELPGEHGSVGLKSTIPVETFNKTIWQGLRRYWASKNSKNPKKSFEFISFLPKLIASYNARRHSSTKSVPNKELEHISKQKELPPLVLNLDNFQVDTKKLFKIGERVRIALKVGALAKRTTAQTFSDRVYTVTAIKGKYYELSDGNLYLENALTKAVGKDNELDESAVRTEEIHQRTKRKLGRSNVKPGHEVAAITQDDQGETVVKLKPRLTPASEKRVSVRRIGRALSAE